MDKNAIFNEFKKVQDDKKKNNNEIKEEIKEDNIETKQTEIIDINSSVKYKNKRKRNKKRNKQANDEKQEIVNIPNAYEKWKEDFLSNEVNKDFMNLLQFYRDKNFSVFSDEEFLKNKYEHPSMKTVVLDPTLIEINAGKGGTCYLIKPLYTDEYNYFLKNIGTRDEKPEEFMKYAVKTGVIYPQIDDITLEKTGAGTILALYNYILQFSDLTKTIRILEV